MSQDSESGFAFGDTVAIPLLLECDSRGQVLWMSERTRMVLGTADNLMGALAAVGPAASVLALGPGLRFDRLLGNGDRMLISAQTAVSVEARVRHDDVELMNLQGNLLRHYFRLQLAERKLSTRARHGRPGSGAGALRQIELERQRLGRELHTGVGQLLAAIRLQLEIIEKVMPNPPEPAVAALGRISLLASDALEQVRSVSKRLHPPEWQRLTLEAALQQLWDMSGIPQRFQTSLRIEPLPREPEFEIKVLLYRSAQEALSNVARHSRATRIEMSLEPRDGRVILTIRDNGVGFDVTAMLAGPASVASGIGLRSVREQTAAMGGKVDIASGPEGTTLEISAPLNSPAS